MFCSKCGSQVPDGMKFCTNCGAALEAAPQAAPQMAPQMAAQPVADIGATVPVQSMQAAPQVAPQAAPQMAPQPAPAPAQAPVYAYQQTSQSIYQQPAQSVPQPVYQQPVAQPAAPKKKKTGLIIGIIVGVVVLLAGAGVGAFLYITNRPMYKAEKAVADGDIKTAVSYYDDLSDSDKDTLKDEILEVLKDYEDQYNDGDLKEKEYKKSLDAAEDVLEDDKDYKELVSNLLGIVGTWSAEIDIAGVIEESIGFSIDSAKAEFILIFEENGDFTYKLEFEDIDGVCESILKAAKTQMMDDYGYSSEEELDADFIAYYGYGFDEFMSSYIDEMKDELTGDDMIETTEYSYEDGVLIINGNEQDFTLKGNELKINKPFEDDGENYGIEFPLTFTRVE